MGEGWVEALRADAQRLLATLGHEGAELSIVLCDDAFIQPLNRDWRDKDQPTDVLSFPQSEAHTPEGGLLGDLVISVETAASAAGRLGHRVEEELQVLLVHGLLHLLGFDHEQGEAEAARMRAEEERLLALLGGKPGLIGRVEAEADGAGPVG
ncbi:MAG: rRNA maturation RNase YbeY [Deltaproteobacteria bacterium]|nr:rRNA maturation RNase YbeY [Deltaproteobacteria bacterium]